MRRRYAFAQLPETRDCGAVAPAERPREVRRGPIAERPQLDVVILPPGSIRPRRGGGGGGGGP